MPLVITRMPGETVVLTTPDGHRIVIEAEPAPAKGVDAVRLTIDAPRAVRIARAELGEPR
jgi:sRNA-binding carbon storage regulator CsrA